MNQKLGAVVQNEHDKFVSEFSITDFPLLHHVLAMIETES